MPIITCLPSNKKIDVPHGTFLFEALTEAGLPVAASCRADFVCGKCNVEILEGLENLSKKSEKEIDLLKREGHPDSDRISCVTRVYGDCTVRARYW